MINIFGALIKITSLSTDTLKLKNHVVDLSKKKTTDTHSNQGGWQATLDINHPTLTDLKKEISVYVHQYFQELSFKPGLSFDFKKIWANINYYRDFNISHHHGTCAISGVYYIQTPLNSGRLIFEHPSSLQEISCHQRWLEKFTEVNSKNFYLTPKKGVLCLFPGWLSHRVESNYSRTPRLSISLNIGIIKKN